MDRNLFVCLLMQCCHGNCSVSIADVNECLFPEVFPCASDERCTDTLGSFRCDPCLEGCDAVGFQCDTWCHNGATCVINDYDDNDIDCLCTDGFTGSNRGPCHNVPSYFQLSYISNDSHIFAYFAILNVFITELFNFIHKFYLNALLFTSHLLRF